VISASIVDREGSNPMKWLSLFPSAQKATPMTPAPKPRRGAWDAACGSWES